MDLVEIQRDALHQVDAARERLRDTISDVLTIARGTDDTKYETEARDLVDILQPLALALTNAFTELDDIAYSPEVHESS